MKCRKCSSGAVVRQWDYSGGEVCRYAKCLICGERVYPVYRPACPMPEPSPGELAQNRKFRDWGATGGKRSQQFTKREGV